MFQCKDLLLLTTMSKAKIIAGEGGLERGIRWAYKAENINFEKWVHGQELLIVSAPVTQRKNYDLFTAIEKAIDLKLSCALLLIGENFVTNVDDKVKRLADNNNFPLFTIPCDVPLVDFFEELGHAISYLDDRKDIQDNLLAEIIFGNSINIHNIEYKCSQMGYNISVLEQVFVIHLDSMVNDDVRLYAESLGELFRKKEHSAIVSSYGDRIIGFMEDCSSKREIIIDIFNEFDEMLQIDHEGFLYTLNVGEKCESIKALQKSFQETSKVNAILEHINKYNEVVFYDEMGYYKLMMAYDNHEPMIRFVQEILSQIIDYDQKNKTQLIDTLWMYFECNRNMKRTADKLFSHKNTIKYRLHRIEEITGRDLNNSFQTLELYNALIMYKVIILSSGDK